MMNTSVFWYFICGVCRNYKVLQFSVAVTAFWMYSADTSISIWDDHHSWNGVPYGVCLCKAGVWAKQAEAWPHQHEFRC
jgi:hypothetical protein